MGRIILSSILMPYTCVTSGIFDIIPSHHTFSSGFRAEFMKVVPISLQYVICCVGYPLFLCKVNFAI